MKILINTIDAPANFNPHEMLRDMINQANYRAHTVKSITFTDEGAQIDMQPHPNDPPHPSICVGMDLHNQASPACPSKD